MLGTYPDSNDSRRNHKPLICNKLQNPNDIEVKFAMKPSNLALPSAVADDTLQTCRQKQTARRPRSTL